MSDYQACLGLVGSLLCLAALIGAYLAVTHELGATNAWLEDHLARLADRKEIRP